jgi:hypothetical protein
VLTQRYISGRPESPWEATLWDAGTGERRFTGKVAGQVRELLPVPGGKLLVCRYTVDNVAGLQAWDAATGEVRSSIDRGFDPYRARYAVTPDGTSLVACDQESVAGYDLRTGRERFAWKPADRDVLGRAAPKGDRPVPDPVSAVAASPDGKTLAISVRGPAYVDVSKRTDSLVLVEAETGKVTRRAPTPETSSEWLVFSADGRWLAGPQCVWEVGTLKEVRRFPDRPRVTAAGFSPDGRRVATGHANGTALVWTIAGK